MKQTILGVFVLLPLVSAIPTRHAQAETRELLHAAYTVPKEAYERPIIPAFEQA